MNLELMALINAALASGRDVEIRIIPRADMQEGAIYVPIEWLAKLTNTCACQRDEGAK